MAYARSTYRRRRYNTKKRTTRSKKRPSTSLPRFNFSRKRYSANRRISSMLSRFSETKLSAMARNDEVAPSAIQLGALAYQAGFVVGGVPTSWNGFLDLQGMGITQGVAAGQRIGDYVYMKKAHLTLEIDMKKSPDSTTMPHEFRVIVFKARRGAYPSGVTKDPSTSLLLDETGNAFGHASAGFNGTDLLRQPLNTRSYTIKHDYKFMLSNPLDTLNQGASSSYYPCMRRFYFNLPFYKKAHFDGVSPTPSDLDFHWAVMIFSRSLDKDVKASDWEVNTRGNVSWMDN